MKDLLLCDHVVVKTLNLEISRRHLQTTSKNCTKVHAARAAIIFLHSTNQTKAKRQDNIFQKQQKWPSAKALNSRFWRGILEVDSKRAKNSTN